VAILCDYIVGDLARAPPESSLDKALRRDGCKECKRDAEGWVPHGVQGYRVPEVEGIGDPPDEAQWPSGEDARDDAVVKCDGRDKDGGDKGDAGNQRSRIEPYVPGESRDGKDEDNQARERRQSTHLLVCEYPG
jgi:hypothetical protein